MYKKKKAEPKKEEHILFGLLWFWLRAESKFSSMALVSRLGT